MAELTDNFAALTEQDTWIEAATVLAGLVAPAVVEQGIERVDQVPDLPAEGYGVAAIILAEFAPIGDSRRLVQVGAGSNVLINGVGRFTQNSPIDQYIPDV